MKADGVESMLHGVAISGDIDQMPALSGSVSITLPIASTASICAR